MADVGSLLKFVLWMGGRVNLNYLFIPIAILDCTPTAMTYSTKLKTKKTGDHPADWLSSCYLQRPEPNWLKNTKE